MTELNEVNRRSEDGYDYVSYSIIHNSEIVGEAGVMTGSPAYVERIDIDEQYRGNGYGTEALKALSEIYNGIYLAPDNEDAQRLYIRLGREYTGDDADYVDQGYGVYEI